MEIDRIGLSEHYAIYKRNIVKPKSQAQSAVQDTISLTKTALLNADILRVRDIAMSAPDMRMDRLSEVRRKLQEPHYPDASVIASTVECLLEQRGV